MSLGIPGVEQSEQIGRGGSAVVYRAWQPAFGRWVAVKIFPPDEDARRLERERLAVGQLSDHPGITPVLGGGITQDGRPYLLMSYMEGGSLGDRVAARGALPLTEVVSLGVALASALQVAHDQGIWHRDLKPANILYDRFDSPRLADFGIAHVGSDGFRTGTGLVSGTAAYMAPELLDGQPFTAASDVFSLGATLYYALVGDDLFTTRPGESYQAFLVRRLTHPEEPTFPATVPDWMSSVVLAATARDPRERIPSAAGLAQALSRGASTQPGNAIPVPVGPGPTPPQPRTPAPIPPPPPAASARPTPRPGPPTYPGYPGYPTPTQPPHQTGWHPAYPSNGYPPPPTKPAASGTNWTLVIAAITVVVLLVAGGGIWALRGLLSAAPPTTDSPGVALSDDPAETDSPTAGATTSPETTGGKTTPGGRATAGEPSTATGAAAITEAVEAFRTKMGTPDPYAVEMVFYPYPDPDDSARAIATLLKPQNPSLADEYTYSNGSVGPSKAEPITAADAKTMRWKFSEVTWPAIGGMLTKTDSVCRAAMTEGGLPDEVDEFGEKAGLTHVIIERDDAFNANKVIVRVYFGGGARWDGGYVSFSSSGSMIDNYCTLD